jgi:hypothetical protein
MRNVFLLYMPRGNHAAMVHYQDTIKNRVTIDRVTPFISAELRAKLRGIFGPAPFAVWGSAGGPRNRSSFETMSPGDDVIIVEGATVRLMGKIAAKVESAALSNELWRPIGKGDTSWELIYFIANARELELPFAEFCRLLGYKKSFQLRGFTPVAEDRLTEFYSHYDDLYSVLERIQRGEPAIRRTAIDDRLVAAPPPDLVELHPEQVNEIIRTTEISDHVRMQWKLARLGLKAGERVWVPVGDQSRLKTAFQFDGFDPHFTVGIDLPHSYVENIDVVWKQEFRIGAAYEIENSTSIYSGLLRFADLNVIAPNTTYPMFVVAPRSRKRALWKQLHRPTFKRLELDRKVRFLSYEAVDEIDAFFQGSRSGLNVETIFGKSEVVV